MVNSTEQKRKQLKTTRMKKSTLMLMNTDGQQRHSRHTKHKLKGSSNANKLKKTKDGDRLKTHLLKPQESTAQIQTLLPVQTLVTTKATIQSAG
jgi:hypothetical protein